MKSSSRSRLFDGGGLNGRGSYRASPAPSSRPKHAWGDSPLRSDAHVRELQRQLAEAQAAVHADDSQAWFEQVVPKMW